MCIEPIILTDHGIYFTVEAGHRRVADLRKRNAGSCAAFVRTTLGTLRREEVSLLAIN